MKVLTFDGLTRFLNNLKDLFTLKSEFTQHTSNHAPKTITGGDNILLAYDGVMDKLTIEAVRRPTLFYSSVTASDSTSSLDYDDIDTTNTPSGVIPKEGDFILCSNGYLFKINYAGSSLGVSLCHVVEDGEDGETYKMQVSALAIGKTASGSYKQSTITMKGYRQVGSGLFALYACRFKIETTTSTNLSSASWTSRYTATSNASSYAYTIPSGVTGIRCSMYLAGGTSTLLDQVIIPIIMDGMDASLPAVLLLQPLADNANDHFIGHQLAGVHIGLGLQPGGRTVLDGGTQDVAGRDAGDAQLLAQDFRLGAFTGTGGAQ